MINQTITLNLPLEGSIKHLNTCDDPLVAEGLLGHGVLIEPIQGKVVAPCDLHVVLVYPTKHALILKSVEGLAILIHIGLDAESKYPACFHTSLCTNEFVKRGSTLMEFDLEVLIQNNVDVQTLFVFPNIVCEGDIKVLSKSNTTCIEIKRTR